MLSLVRSNLFLWNERMAVRPPMPPLNSACITQERTYPTGVRAALEMTMSRPIESLAKRLAASTTKLTFFGCIFAGSRESCGKLPRR